MSSLHVTSLFILNMCNINIFVMVIQSTLEVIDWKQFWQIWQRWPWPMTPKSPGILCNTKQMWTKCEEGSSRCSRVIDQKQKGYRETGRMNMCKAIWPLFLQGNTEGARFSQLALCIQRFLRQTINLRREFTVWELKNISIKWNVGLQMLTYTQNCINVWKCIGTECRTYVYISGVSTVLNWKQG